ncbi:MAG: hypothetical protein AB7P12_14170 [Alphaproteobacteria bacterium]
MFYALPKDPDLLVAIGVVAVRHGQLDDCLRMVIKSLADLTPLDARRALGRTIEAGLRKRVLRLAKRRLGDGQAFLRLEALIARAREASERRNGLLHGIWATVLDGGDVMLDGSGRLTEIPKIDDLQALAVESAALANEPHEARLHGFLREALECGKDKS